MLFRYVLVFALSAPLGAAADTSWTATGANGGSATGGTSCTGSDRSSTCSRFGSVTAPSGTTRSYDTTRVATSDGVTITRNGLRGGTLTRARNR